MHLAIGLQNRFGCREGGGAVRGLGAGTPSRIFRVTSLPTVSFGLGLEFLGGMVIWRIFGWLRGLGKIWGR